MDSSKLKRDVYDMPQDVEERLTSENLLDRYHDRPPYQQNDYIGWITRAKRSETREKRLDQMLFELRDGHLYMNMTYTGK